MEEWESRGLEHKNDDSVKLKFSWLSSGMKGGRGEAKNILKLLDFPTPLWFSPLGLKSFFSAYMCFRNAANIFFTTLNSFSGLDGWYHFQIGVSLAPAVKLRRHQHFFQVTMWYTPQCYMSQFCRLSSLLRSSSVLRSSTFFNSSSFLRSSSFIRLSSF